MLAELTRCYARALGVAGEVTVRFEDDLGVTSCPAGLGSGVTCPVAGTTWPYTGVVTFWGPWARGETDPPAPLEHMALGAAHEACHLSGVLAEGDAQTCSELLVESTDCLTRYGDDAPWVLTFDAASDSRPGLRRVTWLRPNPGEDGIGVHRVGGLLLPHDALDLVEPARDRGSHPGDLAARPNRQ